MLRGAYGNSILLGDAGYACTSYLLTPLLNPHSEAERRYNQTQILMRNAVERLFGVWKRRFPSLATGLQIRIQTILVMIVACAVLHNIALDDNDFGDGFDPVEEEIPDRGQNDEIINQEVQILFIIFCCFLTENYLP